MGMMKRLYTARALGQHVPNVPESYHRAMKVGRPDSPSLERQTEVEAWLISALDAAQDVPFGLGPTSRELAKQAEFLFGD